MRRPRNLIQEETSCYHLVSRTISGEPLIGAAEQAFLQELMWQVADFSGIRVITHAIMEDHFHVLVEVPSVDEEVTEAELIRRFKALYPQPTPSQPLTADDLRELLKNKDPQSREIREKLSKRMGDPAWFMKSLKQRFSRWYNRSKDRFGPFWNNRYDSVLVQNDPWALAVVSAYIDLNAVRAGLVKNPADYLFCGYGKADKKDTRALKGLAILGPDRSVYAKLVQGTYEKDSTDLSRDDAVEEIAGGTGKVPVSVALRCRVRYFTDGMVIGSPDFVEEHAKAVAINPKRERIAHPMLGADWKGLAVGTGLRQAVFQ